MFSQAQEGAFPTDDEINLLLTQADRSMQHYKPLIDQEELQFGKSSAEAVAKDRGVVRAVETALHALKKRVFAPGSGRKFEQRLSSSALCQSFTLGRGGRVAIPRSYERV